MSSDIHQNLTDLCAAYAVHLSISHWRVSYLARGDGQFFRRLSEGKSCTVKTAAAVMTWFDANWPVDLEWPRHIPRPNKSKKEAA